MYSQALCARCGSCIKKGGKGKGISESALVFQKY
jgi:hypothetical protein